MLISWIYSFISERIRASFQVTNVGVQQMLNETYPEVGKRLRQPLEKMFMQLQTILASPSVEAITVESVVEDFFNAHLFPQLYLCAVRDCRGGDSLSSPYTNCLAKLVNSTVSNYHHQSSLAVMEPSGTLNGPRLLNDLLFELKAQLRNAIETVRLYMNGLELAADIVKKSSHSRSPTTFLSSSCQKALARLKFCRFCGRAEDVLIQTSNNSSEFDNGWIETPRSYGMGTGEPVPICRNFCLNVVSGCLSPFISPIETQWDGLLRELKMFSYLLANGNSHWDLEMVLAKADVTLQRIVEKAYEDKLQLMTLVVSLYSYPHYI